MIEVSKLIEFLDSKEMCNSYEYQSGIRSYSEEPEYQNELLALMSNEQRQYHLEKINCEVLTYWANRAKASTNVQLKANYATLVWEFKYLSKGCIEKPFEYAKMAVENYLVIGKYENLEEVGLGLEQKRIILKALELIKALSMKDRISEIADIMLNVENAMLKDDLIGLWGYCYDELISNNSIFTETQENQIIDLIKERYERLSGNSINGEDDNFHAVIYAAEKLVKYYFKFSNTTEILEVLKVLENVIDNTVETKLNVKDYRYKLLYDLYQEVQITSENGRLLKKIEEASKITLDGLKTLSVEHEISKEELDAFTSTFISDDLSFDLKKIGATFIPKIKDHEKMLESQFRQGIGILSDLVAHVQINHEGIATNEIDMSKPENKIANHIVQSLQIKQYFLNYVLIKLFEKHGVTPVTLTDELFTSPVFIQENKQLLLAAIEAYFEEKYVAFIHITTPFIEATLRNLVRLNGDNIYKPNKIQGYDTILLGDILANEKITQALGEDLLFYIKLLFNDKRGLNLRNTVAHGILPPSMFNKSTANLILHTLFTFTLFSEL